MDCKILDRANKRLAKQHAEIEVLEKQLAEARAETYGLAAQLDDAKWKYHREVEDGAAPGWWATERNELGQKVKELQEQVSFHKEISGNYAKELRFQKERTTHFADLTDRRTKDVGLLHRRIDELDEERYELESQLCTQTMLQRTLSKSCESLEKQLAQEKKRREEIQGRMQGSLAAQTDLSREIARLRGYVKGAE